MKVTVDMITVEIDLGSLDLGDQREAFKELLETVPDKDLAVVFEESASQDLEDKLKGYFMEKYGLVEEEEDETPSAQEVEG